VSEPNQVSPHIKVDRLVHSDYEALVADIVLSSGLRHTRDAEWASGMTLDALDAPGSGWESIASDVGGETASTSDTAKVARDTDGNILVATRLYGRLACRVFARSATEAASLLESVRRVLPRSEELEEEAVHVTFWSATDSNVGRVTRRITVPSWTTVRDNYNAQTRDHVSALIERAPVDTSGKLILWHGLPGTGKTWALRALLREWRTWASGHYILDPERFFGQSATYMMSVLMDDDGDSDDLHAASKDRWRLLVIEDAGELLGKDAKLQAGQGLARLLNVCDGLVGQGLKVLILVTTNEELGTMHPAVIRRGRCIANIRFNLLAPHETREWAAAHGVPTDGEKPGLLADLFAADQITTSNAATITGFRPRSYSA
jgi:Domain of unknown function (DUF5925)/ATPase family associated with various cellular activities (AAA)